MGRNHAEKTKMDVINSGGLFGLMNAPYLSMPCGLAAVHSGYKYGNIYS